MAPWFSRLNPTPGFPPYSGPYDVGSVNVEIAASDLQAPSPAPDPDIATIAFRIFYPCEASSAHGRREPWLQHPQRQMAAAYARFLGAKSAFSEAFSFLAPWLYIIRIPVHVNARLLPPPTKRGQWPVMVFSHGLGGSRNTYSHLCGSLSSHGIVVVAPEHRDGSAPMSFVAATESTNLKVVDYRNMPHSPTQEVYQGRDEQLKIRLWEMGLTHEALLAIDAGKKLKNIDPSSESHGAHDGTEILGLFKGLLDVHEPGRIIWAGHSFGAATIVQFVKSTFWNSFSRSDAEKSRKYSPLFNPSPGSAITRQITSASHVSLLDLWCLPLRSPSTTWLWNKPMPGYARDGPGGTNLLAILSEAFFKWQGNLKDVQRTLSEDPSSSGKTHSKPGARIFYPVTSAHLSQSDFGILFPWVTKKVLHAEEPERTLKLNVRAILEVMRQNDIEVADTSSIDTEEEQVGYGLPVPVGGPDKGHDWHILDPRGKIRGWVAVTTEPDHLNGVLSNGKHEREKHGPSDAVMETEVLGEVRA